MKKEELIALGIDEETAQKVVDKATDELKGYIPKARFDEVNEAKKNAESLLKERDKQLEDLKVASSDSETLKKQIEDLQKSNKETSDNYEKQIKQIKIDNAVEKAISDANGKNAKAIKALLQLDDATLDEDGTIKGLKEQIETLASAEDSSFLFGSSVPNVKGFTPAASTDEPSGTPDFKTMTYEQLTSYLESNPDAKLQ